MVELEKSEAEAKGLMADSRGTDIFFPDAEHFVSWTWTDGGNSTTDRHPTDLSKGLQATKGQYFGGGNEIIRGSQQDGKPLMAGILKERSLRP